MKRRYREVVRDALPATARDIHNQTGLSRVTIWRWLTDLHRAGEIHIARWVAGGTPGVWLPEYVPGSGRDAAKPAPKGNAHAVTKYRRRARQDGRWEEYLRRERAKYWARRKVQADPLLVALARPAEGTYDTN